MVNPSLLHKRKRNKPLKQRSRRKRKPPKATTNQLYRNFSVAADIVVFDASSRSHKVLLIQRKFPPYKNSSALPGGFLELKEDAETAARRELREETGLGAGKLQEFGSFSHPTGFR